ncbi:MAG: T9SS type A sorting domain-containing protein [Bacteroidia bacterium]|nr:T9SS type A sorting domain-containing protein [Bacteroidia bacterium]
MIRIHLFVCLFLLGFVSTAQSNFVPNPGFESVSNCSATVNVLNCTPWFKPTDGTPDNFHQCFTNSCCTVPANGLGYQNPNTGMGYAGIGVHGGGSYREYLEVQLLDSLIAGKLYCVQFYISFADSYSGYGIDAIGAFFATDTVQATGWLNLPYVPQIENTLGNCISDTTNWVLISDTFIASGGECFIVIGNFRDDIGTDTSCIYSTDPLSYLFIDDVVVTDCGWSGVEEETSVGFIDVYPNPSVGVFNCYSSIDIESMEVFDMQGRLIFGKTDVGASDYELDLSGQPDGLYLLKVHSDKGVISKRLILVQ